VPLLLAIAVSALQPASLARAAERPGPPNVLILLADDLGYADLSIQGSREIATPHIDSIGRDGVRFTNGYVASSMCSPSRAALLTGRYPQRFGHEFNPPRVTHPEAGLPLSETTLADRLKARGYATVALGKWHLGSLPGQHPNRRGFDHFYGFLKGKRPYTPSAATGEARAMMRNGERVPETFAYLTDELGREAADQIARHRDEPFLLYVSFSAVHTPLQAKPSVLAGVPRELPEPRRKLVAMTRSLDDAVGAILGALDANGLRDRTLVVFLSDNGAAERNASSNAPLRGQKWELFEGGVRVPFLARWPGVLPRGAVYEPAVSSLDIVPTALAAAGVEAPAPGLLDGVDLVPHVTAHGAAPPHPNLHWRQGPAWAIRSGPWKLVSTDGSDRLLFDLASDHAEQHDVAAQHPERVAQLAARHEAWARTLAEPSWPFQTLRPQDE